MRIGPHLAGFCRTCNSVNLPMQGLVLCAQDRFTYCCAQASQASSFPPARTLNSAKIVFFSIEEAMKRDQMLMEAILGQLLQSPDPLIGTSSIVQRLNVELSVVHHHLNLLQDRELVQESKNGVWRLTNQGHDYLEGTPEQSISLNLSSK